MTDRNKMYALIIGVGDDLPYTAKDATRLYHSLIDPELVGYHEENVILLTDKNATREGILGAFDTLRTRTDKESSVLFYYSGHGGKYRSQHKFFLQPYGMTAENYETTWVKAEELVEKVNALESNRLVFLLDCCHAEGMTQDGLMQMQGMAQKLNDQGGVWVISSCQDDQKSWRLPDDENSLFTECLLEVLSGKHKSPFTDPEITITDVVEHIFQEVPKRALGCLDDTTGQPIDQRPYAKFQMSENVVLSTFPRNLENYEATIRELEPKREGLDERHLLKLLEALEFTNRKDEAIAILKAHPRTQDDADLLNALGDLYKSKYLESYLEEDGKTSLECHTRALDLAMVDKDGQQIYLNAINLAFLFLMLDFDKQQMREYARQAIEAAEAYFYPSIEKSGTMGEGHIYLNQLEEAKIHYQKVAEKGGIRERMKIYQDAYKVYTVLYNENPADEFLVFLKEALLG